MSVESEKELLKRIDKLEKMLKVCKESLEEYKTLLMTISDHFNKK